MKKVLLVSLTVWAATVIFSGCDVADFGQGNKSNDSGSAPIATNDLFICNPDGTGYYGDPGVVGTLPNGMNYFIRNEQYQKAELTARAIIDKNLEHGDKRGAINVYFVLKIALQMQGKLEQTLSACEEQLKLALALTPRNPTVECNVYIDKGGAFVGLERWQEAEEALITAKKIAKDGGLDKYLPDINHNLAVVKAKIPAINELVLPGNPRGKIDQAKIEKAIKTGRWIKDRLEKLGKSDVGFNSCLMAVEQPDFSGVIGEEGCVIAFDDQDNPTHGRTTRIFNSENGQTMYARGLTDEEIKSSAKELKNYYQKVVNAESRKTIKMIVIFSNTFKMAGCESILNEDRGKDYYMKADARTRTAKLYRVEGDKQTLIAEEEIY